METSFYHRIVVHCGLAAALLLSCGLAASGSALAQPRAITDMAGRVVTIPERVERVICSGPGCLRLLTYLDAQRMAVAVDSIERRGTVIETRPYSLANPQFRDLPLFGEFRGKDNPELIAALAPAPQVVLKVDFGDGTAPDQLTAKTGLPLVLLRYGDLGPGRADLDAALRLMGEVVGKKQRAEEVIGLFNAWEADLAARTRDIPEAEKTLCYVGGVAMKGARGMQSTEPSYPPFRLGGACNAAAPAKGGKAVTHADVPKEQIVAWDPEVIFLDVSTLTMGEKAGGLHELRTDPAYGMLRAVRGGRVYGVLPYNSYSANFGSIYADAYFVGKTLHPERFTDVDPAGKADQIYMALVGKPVFGMMQQGFDGMVFRRIPVR